MSQEQGSINKLPLLFFLFLNPYRSKNDNRYGRITASPLAAAFYSGRRYKTPPQSLPISLIFMHAATCVQCSGSHFKPSYLQGRHYAILCWTCVHYIGKHKQTLLAFCFPQATSVSLKWSRRQTFPVCYIVGIMLSLLEQAPEPPAEAQNTHFKPNEFFRTTQSLSFVIGEEKVLRSDTFFLSLSPSSGKRDAVRLLLRRYPSLICICVSPHVEVAGSTGRVPFAYFSVLLTGLAPQAQTLKCLSSPKLRMNWFMGIWWIKIFLMASRRVVAPQKLEAYYFLTLLCLHCNTENSTNTCWV